MLRNNMEPTKAQSKPKGKEASTDQTTWSNDAEKF
jgi:hypothetical protein